MKRLACLVALLAAPALAQERMAQDDCLIAQDKLARTFGLSPDLPIPEVDEEGWCVLSDILIPNRPQLAYRIGTLRWRASDIARFIEDTLPPRGLDVEVRGATIAQQSGNEVFDYLLALQTGGINVSMATSLRWDGVQKVVTISDSYVDFGNGNRIEGTARIEGVDLSDMTTITASAGTEGLRSLTLQSQFNGWFEMYVAMLLGNVLLQDNGVAPQTQVDALKETAIAALAWLPSDSVPDASRAALSDFINTLPRPRGDARLSINADPAIGALRAVGVGSLVARSVAPSEIAEAALEGVSVQFTWTQSEPAQ